MYSLVTTVAFLESVGAIAAAVRKGAPGRQSRRSCFSFPGFQRPPARDFGFFPPAQVSWLPALFPPLSKGDRPPTSPSAVRPRRCLRCRCGLRAAFPQSDTLV